MNENTINTLTTAGGKLWENGAMRRIYFNASAWGLAVTRYSSGNINHASINGESISNSEAYRCEAIKVWFDLADGKFHTKGEDALHATARAALAAFIATTSAAL